MILRILLVGLSELVGLGVYFGATRHEDAGKLEVPSGRLSPDRATYVCLRRRFGAPVGPDDLSMTRCVKRSMIHHVNPVDMFVDRASVSSSRAAGPGRPRSPGGARSPARRPGARH